MPRLMSSLLAPLITLCVVTMSGSVAGAEGPAVATLARIIIPQTSSRENINHEDYYFSRLLKLALEKTESTHGPFQIEEAEQRLVDKRLRTALIQGKVDVLWSSNSAEFEQQMLPVRISLLKELNNFRLLLIRNGDQPRFSAVDSLDDLRKLKGGMSAQWADAKVMRQNNLPLVEAVGYGKLFKMLAAGRFDYFSRGLYQIQPEVNLYPELELQIEQELMLHYRNDVYFFVDKNNSALAERLETGLTVALADGSFDELFNSIPRYQWGLALLQNHQRRVLELIAEPAALVPVKSVVIAE
ncbi:MAG TPA: diguanylate cyclase [Cellvibrio sp.]